MVVVVYNFILSSQSNHTSQWCPSPGTDGSIRTFEDLAVRFGGVCIHRKVPRRAEVSRVPGRRCPYCRGG